MTEDQGVVIQVAQAARLTRSIELDESHIVSPTAWLYTSDVNIMNAAQTLPSYSMSLAKLSPSSNSHRRGSSWKDWFKGNGKLGLSRSLSTNSNKRRTLRISNPIPILEEDLNRLHQEGLFSGFPPSAELQVADELQPPRSQSSSQSKQSATKSTSKNTGVQFSNVAEAAKELLDIPTIQSAGPLMPPSSSTKDDGPTKLKRHIQSSPTSGQDIKGKDSTSLKSSLSFLRRKNTYLLSNSWVPKEQDAEDSIKLTRDKLLSSRNSLPPSHITRPQAPLSGILVPQGPQEHASKADGFFASHSQASQDSTPMHSPLPLNSNVSRYSRSSIGMEKPGGLQPRPSSIRRNVTITVRSKKRRSARSMESINMMDRKLSSTCSRPSSFGGVVNKYGTLKITEAVSTEARLQELESQVFGSEESALPPDIQCAKIGYRNSLKISKGQHRSLTPSIIDVKPSDSLKRRCSQIRMNAFYDNGSKDSPQASSRILEGQELIEQDNLQILEHEQAALLLPQVLRERNASKSSEQVFDLRRTNSFGKQRKYSGAVIKSSVAKSPKRSRFVSISTVSKGNLQTKPARVYFDYTSKPQRALPATSCMLCAELALIVKKEQRRQRDLEIQVQQMQDQLSLILRAQFSQSSVSAPSTIVGNSQRQSRNNVVSTPDRTPPINYSRLSGQEGSHRVYDMYLDSTDKTSDEIENEELQIQSNTAGDGTPPTPNDQWATPVEVKNCFLDTASDEYLEGVEDSKVRLTEIMYPATVGPQHV